MTCRRGMTPTRRRWTTTTTQAEPSHARACDDPAERLELLLKLDALLEVRISALVGQRQQVVLLRLLRDLLLRDHLEVPLRLLFDRLLVLLGLHLPT